MRSRQGVAYFLWFRVKRRKNGESLLPIVDGWRAERPSIRTRLTPMAFLEDPLVMALLPTMLLPARPASGGLFPPPRRPVIGIAIPSLVTIYPDISASGHGPSSLDQGSGRSYSNHNFRRRHAAGREQSTENQTHPDFLHDDSPVDQAANGLPFYDGVAEEIQYLRFTGNLQTRRLWPARSFLPFGGR